MKQTNTAKWRRAPVLLPLLALLPGCTILFGERVLYADWRSYKITMAHGGSDTRDMRVPQSGEIVTLATLSDGVEAIELTCAGPEWMIPQHQQSFGILPEFSYQRLEDSQRRESGFIARELCIAKAVRVCRLQTWNGRSTFALMDEYEYFGRIDGESKYGRRIYVRCMRPDTFKKWASSVDKSAVARFARKEWEKLLGGDDHPRAKKHSNKGG